MKRLTLLIGILLSIGTVLGDTIEQNDYIYYTCNNATSPGALLCSNSNLTCYNSSDTLTVNASATNIMTGWFKFQYTNTTGRYGCFIDCCAGAVDYVIPIYVTTTPLLTSQITAIETAISLNTTFLESALTQNFTQIQTNLSHVLTNQTVLYDKIDGVETAVDQNFTEVQTNISHLLTNQSTIHAGVLNVLSNQSTLYNELINILNNQTILYTEINNVTDEVWDELLTGATHNIATSAGRRLRQIAGFAIRTETAQDGSINTIQLDSSASSTDGIYNRDFIVITEGTGVGQTRIITEYNGTTKNATINRDWKITPDATSVFQILANDVEGHPNHGYTEAGGASNITLEGAASSTDDIYNGYLLYISTGTGAQQARLVTDYNGTTKVAIVSPSWLVQPDSTSLYHIDYGVRVNVETNNDKTGYALSSSGVDSIWNKDISGWSVLGYAGTYLKIIYDNQSSFVTAAGFSTHSAIDVDTQLNSSHPGNWSAIGTTGLSDEQNDTLYGIYNVTGHNGMYDQSIVSMLGYNTADGNVETDLDSAGGTTPAAVYEYFGASGRALNESDGWLKNETDDIDNNLSIITTDTKNILTNQATIYDKVSATYNYVTNGSIVNDVWDELATDHVITGTFGKLIQDIIRRCRHVGLSGMY